MITLALLCALGWLLAGWFYLGSVDLSQRLRWSQEDLVQEQQRHVRTAEREGEWMRHSNRLTRERDSHRCTPRGVLRRWFP